MKNRLIRFAAVTALGACFLAAPLYEARADVRICCLGDLNLDTDSWNGTDNVSNNTDTRVYNSAGANYTVEASGGGGSFTLSSGSDSVLYQVWWKASSGTGGSYTQLYHGETSSPFGNANQAISTCGSCGTVNANLKVAVTAGELGKASPGTYANTLTILIAPD